MGFVVIGTLAAALVEADVTVAFCGIVELVKDGEAVALEMLEIIVMGSLAEFWTLSST